MDQKLTELKSLWLVFDDLLAASAYLRWDQRTYMPPGGGSSRARLISTVDGLAHEHLTDPKLGHILDDLAKYEEQLDSSSDEASMIRVARRDYDRWTKIPSEFFRELSGHTSNSYQAWTQAREEDDFESIEPYLEKTLELSREYSEFLAPYEHIADPLVSEGEPEMTTAQIKSVFAELRPRLVALLKAIERSSQVDQSIVHQTFPLEHQKELVSDIVSMIGFDYEHGRQDQSPHPFTTLASPTDVRITTRFKEDDLAEAFFSSMHEAGHGMYEQRIDPKFEGTPLSRGASFAVHESQSRLWENIIGRSQGFWKWLLPDLRDRFPNQLSNATYNDVYSAVNSVRGSLIRVDSDEVTYNLHIMIRFDLEIEMLEGRLAIRDLPDAWNSRYETDLGVSPIDYKDGVLQDVHWYSWTIGGSFHGYTLGNILSAQLYDAAVSENSNIPREIEEGKFESLHEWLLRNVYRHGRKFTADELAEIATGRSLDAKPYLNYLESKYSDIYSL
jgi:carboxypeptidase Taq